MDEVKDDEYHSDWMLCAQEEQLFALFKNHNLKITNVSTVQTMKDDLIL